MKKCPKCHAEIQDNARFCLYCMTSLEEKQPVKNTLPRRRGWVYGVIAALVVALLFVCVFLPAHSPRPSAPLSEDTDVLHTPSHGLTTTGTTTSTQTTHGTVTDSTKLHNSTTATSKNTTVIPAISPTTTAKHTTADSAPTSTTTAPTTAAATYTYRDARYGDDFSVGADTENCVVITGVKIPSANGTYTIPDTLGGKKVIAVMGNAFCDENIRGTVKKVIVPASVRTIWNYAFSQCYNLTDIYFCGNSIYVDAQAFADTSKRNGTLTIHCAANCSDRNFRYYKNSASNYDALYQEWNG